MLASGLSFVGVNGIVRYLGTDLPAAQSAFLRFAFGVVLLLPVLPAVFRANFSTQTLRLPKDAPWHRRFPARLTPRPAN